MQSITGDGLINELRCEGAFEERIHEDEGGSEEEVVDFSSDTEEKSH